MFLFLYLHIFTIDNFSLVKMSKLQLKIFNENVFLICITAIFLASCQPPKVTTARAIAFYDSINHEINLARPSTQRFIDNTTETLSKIKNDKYIKVNTAELKVQLESVKAKNIATLKFMEKITEVDTDINYKKKTVNYIKILDTLLNNEFKACLIVIEQNQDNRFEDCENILRPRLMQLKSALLDYAETKIEFKNKYQFSAPIN